MQYRMSPLVPTPTPASPSALTVNVCGMAELNVVNGPALTNRVPSPTSLATIVIVYKPLSEKSQPAAPLTGGVNLYVATSGVPSAFGTTPTSVGVAEKPPGPLTVTSPVPIVATLIATSSL